MRRMRIAEQALRLTARPAFPQKVCQACLVQAVRQLHSSTRRTVELPFFKRLQKTIFGPAKEKGTKETKEAKETKDARDARKNQRILAPKTKISLEGKVYEVVGTVKPTANKNYVSADTWDNLEHVGNASWRNRKLPQDERYVGYLKKTPVELNDRQWQRLLHHITVEVLALASAQRNPVDVCLPGRKVTVSATAQSRILVDNGKAFLDSTPNIEEMTREVLGESTDSKRRRRNGPPLATHLEEVIMGQKMHTKYDTDQEGIPSWMRAELTDPDQKFAILKRVMQLTNRRIPDILVLKSSTLADLFDALKKKNPPKRLHDAAELKALKSDAVSPNVTVHRFRQTPYHKENEIGRWKIIEEELRSRDLPVLGNRKADSKERLHRLG